MSTVSAVSTIDPRVVLMINRAIKPLINTGCKIERLQMNVCPHSEAAQHQTIDTAYGSLRVNPNGYVPAGLAYVIEDAGRVGGGFAWVSRRKPKI
ncbi:hypothetical protein [Paenibacillus macquariensis]|uniref:Uncharacterized protein n=1 Tax=Paenibacillus macquariensis TaxID=948756 RepID=A0ABY1JSC0_9BACL|nr:hypothetical protein [Paenibacillus macquariensis]MEC0092863.1 hypothetical protein [Paenibacillus macquariensis]OAB36241.1 hypothetical protein PMSM_07265 [Paenibacillus macquariensis subsp. macquariensis]SIQ67755.1 hypothetical protein SAMN05421578_103318 [Paenibacillus macquariensis]